jgi:hypothetical protein
MKLEAKQLRFLQVAFPRLTMRRMFFVTRRNTLHAQETALVIQAYQRRLVMPLLDMFFWPVLSEWTTLTIPYANIESLCERRFVLPRLILSFLVWCPVLLFSYLVQLDARPNRSGPLFDNVLVFFLLCLVALILTLLFNFLLMRPCNYLVFTQGNSKLALICFRIRQRNLQKEFLTKVNVYRRAVAERTGNANRAA